MRKKIVVISGSPRKGGNCELLCDQFCRGAEEAGHEVEKVFLSGKKVEPCLACDYCQRNKGQCVQKDDAAEIVEAMMKSQAIVLATPVYFYNISAQLKTLIDRTYANYLSIKDKKFYLFAAAADTNGENIKLTIDGMKAFVALLPGGTVADTLVGTGVWNKGDVLNTQWAKRAFELGRSL